MKRANYRRLAALVLGESVLAALMERCTPAERKTLQAKIDAGHIVIAPAARRRGDVHDETGATS